MDAQDLLTFSTYHKGNQKVTVDLSQLYVDKKERLKFDERFENFKASDPQNEEVINLQGNILTYQTEEIIPDKTESRIPLLLLFGNPAPQSVKERMFFASEGNGKEHRIWSVFQKTGFLTFRNTRSANTINELNQARKQALYDINYDSPFRIGFAVFYSMPSPPSDKNWCGVAGLHKLFGTKAFLKISEVEKTCINKLIQCFVKPNGFIIAFQKDAYLGVKSPPADYNVNSAKRGLLNGVCMCNPRITIFCAPPTRIIQSEQSIKVLQNFKVKMDS